MGAEAPRVRVEWSKERVTTGWNLSSCSGFAQLRGLSTFRGPLRYCLPRHLGCTIFAAESFFLWTPRGDVSEPEESNSPSHLPSTKLTSPRPYPLLGTGPLGRVLPGYVQGKTFLRAGATAL